MPQGVTRTGSRHGTTSGYTAHQRRGEEPCDACRAAKREYDARWLAGSEQTRRNRLHAKAQSRALARLRWLYPRIYDVLYDEEKRRLDREYRDAHDASE